MKVRLIKESTVNDFVNQNKASYASFEMWLNRLRLADWNMPSDIKNLYTGVDLLGSASNRVIFNIGGNDFRMICKYAFCKSEVRLYICWIGTMLNMIIFVRLICNILSAIIKYQKHGDTKIYCN